MCQSKENGGRRCVGNNPLASNYPAYLTIDKKSQQVVLGKESFVNRPALALHAAVLAARSGYPLAADVIAAAKEASARFNEIPKEQIWEQWNDLTLAEKPSAGLEAIHQMGWEKNFPELAAIRGVPQSPKWHPEGSVEIHTQQAADVAAVRAKEEGLNDSDTRVAVMGAICHDLGKAVSTKFEEDGRITSSGHDDEGYPIAIRFLERIGASDDVKNQVPLIVREHMCHANEPTPKAVRKLMARLENEGNGTTLEAWARVAEADRGGRGTASESGVSKPWMELKEKISQRDAHESRDIIDGAFLRELGNTDFSKYKDIIMTAREAQEKGDITNKEEALSWMKANGHLKN